MWEWLQTYWPIVAVALFYAIKIWRDNKIREIIDKALEWLVQWASGELDKVTEDDVKSAAGYFYDTIIGYLPLPIATAVKILIPKNYIQELAWKYWQELIAPPQRLVLPGY